MSDATSVAPVADGVRLRTPEGQEVVVSVVRACEWLADTKFRERLRRAINASPCPFEVIRPEELK